MSWGGSGLEAADKASSEQEICEISDNLGGEVLPSVSWGCSMSKATGGPLPACPPSRESWDALLDPGPS